MSAEFSSTLDLEPELRRQLIAEAEAEDRSVSALLGELLADYVFKKRQAQDYDVWFDREIDQALKEADDPSVKRVPDEVVQANLLRRMATPRDWR